MPPLASPTAWSDYTWGDLRHYVYDDASVASTKPAEKTTNTSNEELVNLLMEIQDIIEAAHPNESELISKVAEAHDLAACDE